MATRFIAETDRYSVSAGPMPAGASAWTLTWWGKLASTTPDIPVAWAESGASDYLGAGVDTSEDGTPLPAMYASGGVLVAGAGHQLTLGQWYRFAAVGAADGTVTLRWGLGAAGALDVITSAPTPLAAVSVDTLWLGGSHIPGAWLDGSLACVRQYAGALSEAQCEAELASWTPVLGTGLVRDYRLRVPELTDRSSGGYTLTAGTSAPTLDSADPPIVERLTLADAASLTESVVATRRTTVTDPAALAESWVSAQPRTMTDSGALGEAPVALQPRGWSEPATLVEALGVGAALEAPDGASLTEALALGVASDVLDVAGIVERWELASQLQFVDPATLTEGWSWEATAARRRRVRPGDAYMVARYRWGGPSRGQTVSSPGAGSADPTRPGLSVAD